MFANGELHSQTEPIAPDGEVADSEAKAEDTSPRFLNVGTKIGIPHPIDLTASVSLDHFEFGAAASPLAISITVDDVSVSNRNYSLFGHFRPFAGAFFVGVSFGRQILSARKSDDISVVLLGSAQSLALVAEARIRTWYVCPHVGWNWRVFSQFRFGVQLGWLLPFAPDLEISAKSDDALASVLIEAAKLTSDYAQIEREARDVANRIGKHGLPYVNLHFGWSF